MLGNAYKQSLANCTIGLIYSHDSSNGNKGLKYSRGGCVIFKFVRLKYHFNQSINQSLCLKLKIVFAWLSQNFLIYCSGHNQSLQLEHFNIPVDITVLADVSAATDNRKIPF